MAQNRLGFFISMIRLHCMKFQKVYPTESSSSEHLSHRSPSQSSIRLSLPPHFPWYPNHYQNQLRRRFLGCRIWSIEAHWIHFYAMSCRWLDNFMHALAAKNTPTGGDGFTTTSFPLINFTIYPSSDIHFSLKMYHPTLPSGCINLYSHSLIPQNPTAFDLHMNLTWDVVGRSPCAG